MKQAGFNAAEFPEFLCICVRILLIICPSLKFQRLFFILAMDRDYMNFGTKVLYLENLKLR